MLNSDGSLNRKKLRELIFSEPSQKQKLENLLHPLVYLSINTEVERLNTPYCIICIPLLFETHMSHLVDRILVVDCSVQTQIKRLKKEII
jgi:dephospho-CoA kinase